MQRVEQVLNETRDRIHAECEQTPQEERAMMERKYETNKVLSVAWKG